MDSRKDDFTFICLARKTPRLVRSVIPLGLDQISLIRLYIFVEFSKCATPIIPIMKSHLVFFAVCKITVNIIRF